MKHICPSSYEPRPFVSYCSPILNFLFSWEVNHPDKHKKVKMKKIKNVKNVQVQCPGLPLGLVIHLHSKVDPCVCSLLQYSDKWILLYSLKAETLKIKQHFNHIMCTLYY
ncbi:hypothetical protein GDO86_015048 [Hymenochirus boettgeri]|uniref:Uncharacterized protein n=1 Tax=Hymenochirus boettgeri TaxID=247094 RepID=A0A8T2JRE4_9PIPI|nr:hypothetical protein GDO86_015048 [Hymenochirus boettgeri]